MSCKEEAKWTAKDINEGLMHNWFANAMMAMHDHLVNDFANFARQHNLNNAERSYMIHQAIKEHYGHEIIRLVQSKTIK